MNVTLRPLTEENWIECIRLNVTDEQKGYVADNLFSIAETRFEPDWVPLAIYADEVMVGFTMYDTSGFCSRKVMSGFGTAMWRQAKKFG